MLDLIFQRFLPPGEMYKSMNDTNHCIMQPDKTRTKISQKAKLNLQTFSTVDLFTGQKLS